MAPPTRHAIQDPAIWPIVGDRKLVDPTSMRRTWTNSRRVILENGDTIPLLHVLAEHLFGPWDPKEYYPAWKDKDWTNESLDNVQLVSMPAPREKRPNNRSGFPAGSPEYHRWYRAQHPEKIKQYARDAYLRQREQKKEDMSLRAENERLRALLEERSSGGRPSIEDIIAGLTPEDAKAPETPPASPLLQIGTPMTDEEP